MPRLPPASCSPSCLICPFPAPIHRMDTPLDSLESVPSASPLCQAITRPSSWACICRLLLFPACARRRVRLPGAEKEPGSSALHQHGPPRCAGSLLHILLVNLCFLSSHRLVRNLFTTFFALAAHRTYPRRWVGLGAGIAQQQTSPSGCTRPSFLPLISFFVSRACLNLLSFLFPPIVAAIAWSHASRRLLMVGLYLALISLFLLPKLRAT